MQSECGCTAWRRERWLWALGYGVAMVFLGWAAPAAASDATWTGATDGIWSTTTNWTVSPVPGTGDVATFADAGNGNTTLDLGTGVTLRGVLFDTANVAAYTVGSGLVRSQSLVLDNSGAVTMNAAVAAHQSFTANVSLGTATAGSYTFTNSTTTNRLIFNGNVQGGTGGTGGAKTLTVDGVGDIVIAGPLLNGGASSVALTKTGNGTLFLSGMGTYTGATAINGGVLRVQSQKGLGATSGVTVAAGATLAFDGSMAIDRALTLNGSGFGGNGALRNVSGAGRYSGNITMASAARLQSDAGILRPTGTLANGGFLLTVGGAGDTSLWGVVSGTGGLTKEGTGMLRLASANTYTGVSTINDGIVLLANGESVGTSGPLGRSAAANPGSIVFGGGWLQYSESNSTDYSTRFSTAAGQHIRINTSSQSITFATPLISSGGSLTVNGQGTLMLSAQGTYSGATTVTDMATLSLALNTAASNNVVSSSSALVLGGNLVVTGTGSTTARLQTFNGTTFGRGGATITPGLAATSSTANVLTIDFGALSRNAGGTGNLVIGLTNATTTNTQVLTSSGAAHGLITDSNGVAYMTFGTTATAVRNWAVKDPGNTKIVEATSGFYTAATATTLSGNADVGGTSPTVTGAAGDNPLASLRFDNAGSRTVTLDGAGSTFSVGGVLVTSNVGTNATLITGTATLQGPGGGAGDLVIHNYNSSNTLRVASAIGGTGGFTKAGPGTVILDGTNTYGGPTTVSAGTLQVGNGGTTGDLGSTSGDIRVNGTLTFNRSAASSTLTISNNIVGSGGLTQQGAGTTVLQGALTYRGLTTVNAGTLTFATGSNRPFTSRGNITTRGMTGNGLQVNGVGAVNVDGNVDVEVVYIPNGVINVSSTGSLLARQSPGNGFFGFSIGTNESNPAGAAYGMLNITGGSVINVNDLQLTNGPRFGVGIRSTTVPGLVRMTGGNLSAVALLTNNAEITLLGGTLDTSGPSSAGNPPIPNLNTNEGNANTGGALTVVNVVGGTFSNPLAGLNVNGGTAGSSRVVVNVNSGTLWTGALTQGTGSTAGINFNGGTLRAGAASATFTPVAVTGTSTFTNYVNGAFGSYAGGAVIDTDGYNITIPGPLLAPTGSGVSDIPVVLGGSGYVGAPLVTIANAGITQAATTTASSNVVAVADTTNVFVGQSVSGTNIPAGAIVTAVTPNTSITISQSATAAGPATLTFRGLGATAYATIAGGAVSGVVITNPGVGYAGTVSTTLTGGLGSSGVAATVGSGANITTAANTSGGLTKVGNGTLTLSGATTFTGATAVNQGTLAFGFTGAATYASSITGPGTVSQTGSGMTILTGTNTYTGPTVISAGVLQPASAAAIPGGIGASGGTSPLIFSGGALGLAFGDYERPLGAASVVGAANFTGAGGWAAYGADREVNLGGSLAQVTWATANTGFNGQTLILGSTTATHTVDLRNPLDLGNGGRTVRADDGPAAVDGRISGVISGIAGGTLTKTGTGTLELAGNNTYSAGTTISAGTLIFSGNNTGSASLPGVSAGAYAQFKSLNSIPGAGRSVANSGTVILGSAFGAAAIPDGLAKMATSSSGAVAVDNFASTDFDFQTAGLGSASLGAVGNQTYTGTFTPNTTAGYRLGGGGGVLTMSNANALTGSRAVTVVANASVVLTGANDVSGLVTVGSSGTLTFGTGTAGQDGSVAGQSIANSGRVVFNNAASQAYGGVISGTGEVTKTGGGQLTLKAPQTYTGTTTVSAGRLVLAGGNGTLPGNRALTVNGGTLDVGSNHQHVGQFSGTGGSVTGTGASLTVQLTGAATFAGNIQGSVALTKVASQTLTLTGDNTTAGVASILGGGLTLKDSGALSSTTGSIAINGATLTLDNTGTANNGDRINDSKAITLNGGTISYTGRASTNSTETLGAVTAASGSQSLSAPIGSGGSAQLTMTSLTRNTGASILFASGMTNFGTAGNSSRILANATNSALTGNLAPIHDVVPGAFYMVNTDNYFFVNYSTTLGFQQLATTTNNFAAGGVTSNVRDGNGVLNADKTVNSFAQGNLTFTNGTTTGGTDLLTLGSGMAILATNNWGTTTARGRITSGTNELFLFKRDANVTPDPFIHSVMVDKNGGTAVDPADKVSLVIHSQRQDRGYYVHLTAPNLYSGGTFVNAGLLNVNSAGLSLDATSAGIVTVPAGGLTINDKGLVDMTGFAGQIDPTNVVTINGGGQLNLMGTNTLAGIVFNSNGGTVVPTVTPFGTITANSSNGLASRSGTGTLIVTGNITSTPTNLAVTPLISSGTLDLNGSAAHDITVAPLPQGNFVTGVGALNGLAISSVISNGGFTKKGGGVLNLTGTNTFVGPLTVEEGVLNVATINNANANGPLGNSSLPVILGGAGGKTGILEYTGGNVSPTKTFTMATGGMGGFQVDTAAATLTLSTDVAGSGGMAKYGPGTLALSNAANSYAGATVVAAGTLSLTASSSANNIGFSPFIDVQRGATLDVSGLSGSTDLMLVNSQTIGGNGTVVGNMNIGQDTTLSPGAGPGILSQTGNQVWGVGGNYNWHMFDATASAGTGYDRMAITGSLTIEPLFNFNLWSLSAVGSDTNGAALNFDATANGSWIVATASSGLVNPAYLSSASIFTSANNGTVGFTNSFAGTFSLMQGDGTIGTANDVVLTYVVPEPAIALLGLGVAGLAIIARGRRGSRQRR